MRDRFLVAIVAFLLGLLAGVCCGATPAQAVAVAAVHAESTAGINTYQYFWTPNETDEEYVALTMALSFINRTPRDVIPLRLPGCGFVVDRALLANNADDLKEINYQFLLMARDESRFHEPDVFDDLPGRGRTHFSPPARHLGQAGLRLQAATGPTIPILDGRRFVASALASTEQQGIEPRYYGFLGLEVGKTKLTDYLRSRNASLDEADRLHAIDQFQVLKRIPTGRPGSIAFFPVLANQPSLGSNVGSITIDFVEESFDEPERAPYRNLISLNGDAYEVIMQRGGTLEFSLWNKDQLLAENAQGVAHDRTVPGNNDTILFSAKSCVACHASGEMWRGFEAFYPQNVVGDSSRNFDPENISRLENRYRGGVDDILPKLRDDYARQVFRLTRIDEPEKASRAVESIYNAYVYDKVMPEDVLKETGAESLAVFSSLADPLIEALNQGLGISRAEMEQLAPALHGIAQ